MYHNKKRHNNVTSIIDRYLPLLQKQATTTLPVFKFTIDKTVRNAYNAINQKCNAFKNKQCNYFALSAVLKKQCDILERIRPNKNITYSPKEFIRILKCFIDEIATFISKIATLEKLPPEVIKHEIMLFFPRELPNNLLFTNKYFNDLLKPKKPNYAATPTVQSIAFDAPLFQKCIVIGTCICEKEYSIYLLLYDLDENKLFCIVYDYLNNKTKSKVVAKTRLVDKDAECFNISAPKMYYYNNTLFFMLIGSYEDAKNYSPIDHLKHHHKIQFITWNLEENILNCEHRYPFTMSSSRLYNLVDPFIHNFFICEKTKTAYWIVGQRKMITIYNSNYKKTTTSLDDGDRVFDIKIDSTGSELRVICYSYNRTRKETKLVKKSSFKLNNLGAQAVTTEIGKFISAGKFRRLFCVGKNYICIIREHSKILPSHSTLVTEEINLYQFNSNQLQQQIKKEFTKKLGGYEKIVDVIYYNSYIFTIINKSNNIFFRVYRVNNPEKMINEIKLPFSGSTGKEHHSRVENHYPAKNYIFSPGRRIIITFEIENNRIVSKRWIFPFKF